MRGAFVRSFCRRRRRRPGSPRGWESSLNGVTRKRRAPFGCGPARRTSREDEPRRLAAATRQPDPWPPPPTRQPNPAAPSVLIVGRSPLYLHCARPRHSSPPRGEKESRSFCGSIVGTSSAHSSVVRATRNEHCGCSENLRPIVLHGKHAVCLPAAKCEGLNQTGRAAIKCRQWINLARLLRGWEGLFVFVAKGQQCKSTKTRKKERDRRTQHCHCLPHFFFAPSLTCAAFRSILIEYWDCRKCGVYSRHCSNPSTHIYFTIRL